jgi:hypothetical protein
LSRWRKKPVVVEAEVLGPEIDKPDWLQAAETDGQIAFDQCGAIVRTLEGEMAAVHGDWIIKGVAGEIYPCKPHIFAAIYEPADAEPDPLYNSVTTLVDDLATRASRYRTEDDEPWANRLEDVIDTLQREYDLLTKIAS